jgi:hypothetical protein
MALPVLTASEIGAYAFCPQAWYLQRRRTTRSSTAAQGLAHGTLAHQVIGKRTDRLRDTENVRFLLLFVIIALVALMILQFPGASFVAS